MWVVSALAFDQLPVEFAVPAGVGDIATAIVAFGVVFALPCSRAAQLGRPSPQLLQAAPRSLTQDWQS
jgi:hypothetical protein